MNEQLVWKRKSSQLVNLPIFIGSLFFLLLLIIIMVYVNEDLPFDNISTVNLIISILMFLPIIIIIKKYLDTRYRVYYLTTERFRKRHGIINKRIDEVELYRINDTILYEPFWLRVFGLGNITLLTSDLTDNTELILAIPNGIKVKDAIRHYVEKQRLEKSISELDIKQHTPHKNFLQ